MSDIQHTDIQSTTDMVELVSALREDGYTIRGYREGTSDTGSAPEEWELASIAFGDTDQAVRFLGRAVEIASRDARVGGASTEVFATFMVRRALAAHTSSPSGSKCHVDFAASLLPVVRGGWAQTRP